MKLINKQSWKASKKLFNFELCKNCWWITVCQNTLSLIVKRLVNININISCIISKLILYKFDIWIISIKFAYLPKISLLFIIYFLKNFGIKIAIEIIRT